MGDVMALLDYRGTFLFSVDVKYQSSIFTCWGHCDRCMAAAATVLLGRLQTTSLIILTGFTGVWWRNCPRMKHVCTTLYTMKGMPSILPLCTAVWWIQGGEASTYLGVSLWFGDIGLDWVRHSAQYALDCMRKPLDVKNCIAGGPRPFYSTIFFCLILPPPPLRKN